MLFYELPCMDSRKSFYGKAKVVETGKGAELYSYDTLVCRIDNALNVHRIWDGYSATTMRHVNSFLQLFGVNKGGKSYWDSLKVEEA